MPNRILFAIVFAAGAWAQDAPPTTPPAAPPDIVKLLKTAHAAYAKGDYEPARAALDQAWTLAEALAKDDPQRYDVLKQMVAADSAAGDYKAAQYHQELAINWRENKNGTADPKLADEWIEMSTICVRLKDFDRALTLLSYATGRHVQANGANSLTVADDFSRTSLVYAAKAAAEDIGLLFRAVAPLQEAIRIREAVLGAEHPATLPEVDRLAALYITLRMYDKAEDTFRHALVMRERLIGQRDAGLIDTVEGLAYAQFGMKEYAEAEKNYQRLLALWSSVTGDPNHPMVALTLDKMVAFYREQKKWAEADELEKRALTARGIFLAAALRVEAQHRLTQGSPEDAIALLKRALAALDAARPDRPPEFEKMRTATETSLKELGDLESAEKPARPARRTTTANTKSTKQP